MWRSLQPHTSGAYVNFLSAPSAEDIAAVYPADVRERLTAVKQAYDPDRRFSRNLGDF
ncbi:hypothetical protein OHA25_36800 [Nonomuraea sp. NBC_00507]